ncbi:DUF945 family protein [Desulfopila aestuarii]|uniref:Uncharacterized conserved protein YdgA, DUF945 family n=1 Tax=Desulfopila aestuarii DSM 18488 TaxID=1121416 RepID=A0A1M7Y8T9_9BACT|nr:DUF945 family protein [Desulfopila aestuarii]SHO49037.1 Uncharacterized conserved protein YdgA, DUF945 family [Desulfopila aestuarii DSM 18488]
MKKVVIAIVIVLALVGAGMPIINGILMEKGYRELVTQVNTMYTDQGNDMQMDIVRYDRGLTSSEVEWKIDLGGLKAVYGIDEVVVIDRGKHGYRGVTFTSSLEQNPWYSKFVAGQPGGKDPITVVTEYTLGGDIRSNISLLPMTFKIEQDTLESRAAKFDITSDWKLERIQANGTWEGMTVPDKMTLEGVSFNSDVRLISSFIWDGGASAHFGKMSGRDGVTELTMDGLRTGYTAHYDEVNKTLDIEASYGVGLLSDGLDKVENGSATMGVRGLDAAAYEEAMKSYTKILGELLTELGNTTEDPEVALQAFQAKMSSVGLQMVSIVEKFLKPGLEIFVSDVHAGLPQGEVSGDLVVKLEKELTVGQMFPMLQQPEQVFEYLTFHSNMQVPAELVGENPMLLEPAFPGMKTGLFVKDGANLVSKMETRDKKLFLNNEQVDLN